MVFGIDCDAAGRFGGLVFSLLFLSAQQTIFMFRPCRTVWLLILSTWISVSGLTDSSQAQNKIKAEEIKLTRETLRTRDGVKLNAFYFASDQKKDAIPVLIIHDWGGQSSPYGPLVSVLHDAGYAVLIPDLRGHGASDRELTDNQGTSRKLNPSQMSRREVQDILIGDLEAAKGFLKDENNAERLNLNALVVIGAGEGAVLATNWAARDWSFPSLGSVKQGQDVKALVLISPEKQIKGVTISPLFNDANLMRLPTLIVSGRSGPESSDVKRLAKRIEANKKRLGRGEVTGFEMNWQSTSLSAPALVTEVAAVPGVIVKFIKDNVIVDNSVNPWVQRQ